MNFGNTVHLVHTLSTPGEKLCKACTVCTEGPQSMYQVQTGPINVPRQVLAGLQLHVGLQDAAPRRGLIVCLVSHCLEG